METTLTWDNIEDRTYSQGVDRATLYLDDGSAVPWSGIVSIEENAAISLDHTYFEGTKRSSTVKVDSFTGTIEAISFPDEILRLQGDESLSSGIYLSTQHLEPFSMSFRTMIGNAVEGSGASYRIHILLGLLITPQDRAYTTINDSAEVETFKWDINSIPPEIGSYRPTSHIILEEDKIPEPLLESLYSSLYGDGENPPEFSSIDHIIDKILGFTDWQFNDLGDGTFEATPFDPEELVQIDIDAEDVEDDDFELYELLNVSIEPLGEDTYLLLNGYGSNNERDPRTIGGIPANKFNYIVRSEPASDGLSHYIGTAPLGAQEEQSIWRITQIFFGPPPTSLTRLYATWSNREDY